MIRLAGSGSRPRRTATVVMTCSSHRANRHMHNACWVTTAERRSVAPFVAPVMARALYDLYEERWQQACRTVRSSAWSCDSTRSASDP